MCIICNSENNRYEAIEKAENVLQKEYDLQKAIREYKQSLKLFVDDFKENKVMKEIYKKYYYKFIKESKKLNK